MTDSFICAGEKPLDLHKAGRVGMSRWADLGQLGGRMPEEVEQELWTELGM